MNPFVTIVLAIAVLLAGVVNLADWCFRGRKLLVWPTGWLGVATNVLAVAMLVAAILHLAKRLPGSVLFFVMFVFCIVGHCYSIWYRHSAVARAGSGGAPPSQPTKRLA